MTMPSNSLHQDNEIKHDAAASGHRGCPHPSPEESRRRWAQWHQAMELSHEMLMMGLRQRIGTEGDLRAAYRAWYEQYQALKWESKSDS